MDWLTESRTAALFQSARVSDMATVHISEIQQWLVERGQLGAVPGPEGMFLEIRFDDGGTPVMADEELVNQVITTFTPQGNVTLVFDEGGNLRSLDIS